MKFKDKVQVASYSYKTRVCFLKIRSKKNPNKTTPQNTKYNTTYKINSPTMKLIESTWQLFFLILRQVLQDRIIICHSNGVTQTISFFSYIQYWLSHIAFIGEVYFKINGRTGPDISVAVAKKISLLISRLRFWFWKTRSS